MMKVVLFCGGLGTRIREYSEAIPKPMVPIGHQPILWLLPAADTIQPGI
jgi:glucose-1-phosphate cytidylyltransferase